MDDSIRKNARTKKSLNGYSLVRAFFAFFYYQLSIVINYSCNFSRIKTETISGDNSYLSQMSFQFYIKTFTQRNGSTNLYGCPYAYSSKFGVNQKAKRYVVHIEENQLFAMFISKSKWFFFHNITPIMGVILVPLQG